MQNQYHANITRNQFVFAHHPTSDYARTLRNFLHRASVRVFLRKAIERAVDCLATCAVAIMFLGGTYFFLIQLANYGW